MRLLILADYWGDLGGGEVVAAQLAQALRGRFEVAVLTTDRLADSFGPGDGLSIYRLKSNYPPRLRPLLALANPLTLRGVTRVLDDFRPDVVHAWNIHQHLSYASLGIARRRGAATVLTFQDAQPFCYTKYHCYIRRGAPCQPRPDYRARPARCPSCWRHYWLFPPRNRAIRSLIHRHVSRTVSVSRALAEALNDNGLPGAQVIHNGLPLDQFPPSPPAVTAIRQRLGLGEQVVVAGGRMSFFKGQQQLLEAFARVAPERPEAQLVLAGRHDDWFGRCLKNRSAELGLADRVIFAGFLGRQEFLALLSAAALFGNLSLYLDPFPTVNLEAGAAGRAVLGTCFGGTPEVVVDGKTGLLVQPFQLSQVIEGLDALLADSEARSEMGRRAGDRIRALFSLSDMVEAYARLFHSL
jgi:glycosyltransferase involved in cell wall biosynthesis